MKLKFVARENIRVPKTLVEAIEQAGDVPLRGRPTRWAQELEKILGHEVPELGRGSSRYVYAVGKNLVLKVAKGRVGVDQNEAEYKAYEAVHDCSVITRVFYYHPQFHWLLVERVKREAMDRDFQRIYGVSDPEDLLDWVVTAKGLRDPRLVQKAGNPRFTATFFHDLDALSHILNLNGNSIIELCELEQWGIAERQGQEYPVLVDYGWTEEISITHYWGF